MRILLFALLLLFGSGGAVFAQTIGDPDSFEAGAEAFNAGNCKEAVRIMKKHEKKQPIAAYIIRACSLVSSSQKKGGVSYDIFVRDLNKGDLSRFEKLGMISRFSGEVKGLRGAQYLNSLAFEAGRGNAGAQFLSGQLYQEGIGVRRDFKRALDFFEKAAENGHAEAMNSAGLYYRFGLGTDPDLKKAEELWLRASREKNAYALYNSGVAAYENEDYMAAQILAGQAVKRLDPNKEKKNRLRADGILKKARKKTSSLHAAYLKKFVPFRLKDVLDADDARGLTAVKELPLPPEKMIEETSFMRVVRKDEAVNVTKTFFPLMPDWVPFDPDSPADPAVSEKPLPAPSPHEKNVISALYYRVSDPRSIHLTLTRKDNAVPVMVGDILNVSVYAPLHETEATLKGGLFSRDNTGYDIVVQDPANIAVSDGFALLTPLSEETERREAWLSRSFRIRATGSAVIEFVPRKDDGGKTAFPHTLRIVAFQGTPPDRLQVVKK